MTFVEANDRLPTVKEDTVLYTQWNCYVRRNRTPVEGDAACERCTRLRGLIDETRAKREQQESPEDKWARIVTFVEANDRLPTKKDDTVLYRVWDEHLARNRTPVEGDAACERCSRLRTLLGEARAKREQQESPEDKWARVVTFVEANDRLPTEKEDKVLYNLWNCYVGRCQTPVEGDAACDRCTRLRELLDEAQAKREERRKRQRVV